MSHLSREERAALALRVMSAAADELGKIIEQGDIIPGLSLAADADAEKIRDAYESVARWMRRLPGDLWDRRLPEPWL